MSAAAAMIEYEPNAETSTASPAPSCRHACPERLLTSMRTPFLQSDGGYRQCPACLPITGHNAIQRARQPTALGNPRSKEFFSAFSRCDSASLYDGAQTRRSWFCAVGHNQPADPSVGCAPARFRSMSFPGTLSVLGPGGSAACTESSSCARRLPASLAAIISRRSASELGAAACTAAPTLPDATNLCWA